MTDPYIGINGTKIEVFDNDLSRVSTIQQLAGGSKLITATRDLASAVADVAYTGLDFTPTSVFAFAAVNNISISVGGADSLGSGAGIEARGAFAYCYAGAVLISVYINSTEGQQAVIKTYNVNGLTLTWTKYGSPTGTARIYFLCFR